MLTASQHLTKSLHTRFLLPVLQLKQLLNEPSWGLMKKSLQNLPLDLPNTFYGYLSRLGDPSSSSRAHLAWKTLTWLTLTREALDPERLQEALSIQPESTGPDQDFVPSMSCILECCLGLVVVDEHANTVRLVHFSLQEYLRTHIHTIYPYGLEELALDCYRYCSYQDFSSSPCNNEAGIVTRLKQYPLLRYFARHWRFHTSLCSENLRVQAAVIDFMSSDSHRVNLRQMSQFVARYRKHYWTAEEAISTHTLHMLASLGHFQIFKQVLDNHMDKINLQTSLVRSTPVILAGSAGHVEITRYLLLHRADPFISNWYGNALHCAAEANTPSTITLLLDAGMHPDIRTSRGATPLSCTTDHDAAEAAAVLLSRGADPMNIDSERDTNLLIAAVQDRCPRLVSLILSRNCVDIEDVGGYYTLTALRTAMLLLRVEIILLLADATADPAEAELSRRVATLVQNVPLALRKEVGEQLWDLYNKDGWDAVEDNILRLVEGAEAARRFDDLSMEDCEDGAMDED
jgi:ankyrin repeat protein